MSKATPGPWRVNDDGEIFAQEYRLVALTIWEPSSEEDQANANLIAASPELLAEVKRLRHLCEELQGLIDGGEALKIGVEETDALIAKAEGR